MRKSLWGLLLLTLVLGLFNTWGYDLWAPDEPYFGEGAREMIADGQWLIPHVNGVITTDKPPFFFWLIAVCSAPLGAVLSVSARFPSLLATLGSTALIYRLGRRIGGDRTGFLAGLVFATAYLPWDKARSAQTDAVLCFFILTALTAFEAFRAGEADGRKAGILFWAAAGFGTLTKGPVGFLLPLGVVLVTLIWDRDLARFRRFAPLLGPIVLLSVIALWAVPAELFGGEYSLWGALKTHFINRGLQGMHHKNPPWYYLGTIPLQFLPWSFLLPGALLLTFRRRDRTDRFLLAVVLFILLFFTLSGERRDLYVLPAFPALALLVARFAGARLGWETGPGVAAPRLPNRGWLLIPQGILGGLFLAAAAMVPRLARKEVAALAQPAIVLAIVIGLGGIALLIVALGRREAPALWTTAACMSVIYLTAAAFAFPALNPVKSARAFSDSLKSATASSRAAGQPVLAFRLSNLPEAFSFYSGVYTLETGDMAELIAHLNKPQEVFAALDQRILAELPPATRNRLSVVAQAELSRNQVRLVVNRPGRSGDTAPKTP